MSATSSGICRRGAAGATLALLAALATCAQAASAQAQRPAGAQFEGRVDAIAAATPSLQGGVAFNAPAGLYVRLGVAAAGGIAWRDGASRGATSSQGASSLAARTDLFARFLLDPFGQSRLGLYGVGGLSAMYDGFERWRPRVVAGVGLESRVAKGRVWGGELALGGGVRVALFVRNARAFGR